MSKNAGRPSRARIREKRYAGEWRETLPWTKGKNRAKLGRFKCAHCGWLSNPVRWTEFDREIVRSCGCLKTAYVNRQIDEILKNLNLESHEVIAEEAVTGGLHAGVTLAQELGIRSRFLLYAVSRIRKRWFEEFLYDTGIITRSKFWNSVARSGVDTAARSMGWTKAQGQALFHWIKKELVVRAPHKVKLTELAEYRVISALFPGPEYSTAVYGSRARKDFDVRWALNTLRLQPVTSKQGTAALVMEKRTLAGRARRRTEYLKNLRVGRVPPESQKSGFLYWPGVVCWPCSLSVSPPILTAEAA